jgi:hypothetical protein
MPRPDAELPKLIGRPALLGLIGLMAGCAWLDQVRGRTQTPDTAAVLDTGAGGGDDGGSGSGTGDGGDDAPDVLDLDVPEEGGALLDPERGLLTWVDLTDPSDDYTWVRAQGYTLVYAGVSLAAFRDAQLDGDFIEALDASLDRIRAAGIKVVLRFTYTEDGVLDDAPMEVTLGHVSQLAPVLQGHGDVIAVVQAGFLGAWGEWHASSNGHFDDPAVWQGFLSALLEAVPADRMLQVRTPMFKAEAIGGPLTADQAFAETALARVGHHNDCLLASDTDLGTYAEDDVEGWKSFVATESRFLPHGGETCALNPPRTDCAESMAELERLQTSFLNALYHPDVLATWADQGCAETIATHLGHRLFLSEAAVSEAVAPGGLARLRLTLENRGWAPLFSPREAVLLVIGEEGATEVPLTGLDLRHLAAGEQVRLDLALRTPADAPDGDRVLALWLPDPAPQLRGDPRYALRLANDGVFDDSGGWNVLAMLPVQQGASGPVTVTATEWALEEGW